MKPKALPSSRRKNGLVKRWTRTQLFEHWLVLLSLSLLGLTGLALKYHAHAWAAWLLQRMGGPAMSGTLHRTAAVVLIGTVVFHLAHAALTEYGHQEFRRIRLRAQDFRDFLHMLKFNLGSAPEPPKTAKYSYQEKFHYWAVALIVLLMIPSGFVLWFENEAMQFLPKWIYDLTLVLHGGAGLFFFAVVVLSHLYSVHLDPRVFPMDWMWLTGTISEDQLRARHPLEFEELEERSGS